MTLMPCVRAALIAVTDSASSVPPQSQPPIAQVPRPTRDTFSAVPGISANSILVSPPARCLVLVCVADMVHAPLSGPALSSSHRKLQPCVAAISRHLQLLEGA